LIQRKMTLLRNNYSHFNNYLKFPKNSTSCNYSKRRPSFQKSLAKEKSKPLDPSFGLENKYFRVEFKSGRGGVYYIDREKDKKYDMKVGDFVIVEADRGKDLGKIVGIIFFSYYYFFWKDNEEEDKKTIKLN